MQVTAWFRPLLALGYLQIQRTDFHTSPCLQRSVHFWNRKGIGYFPKFRILIPCRRD